MITLLEFKQFIEFFIQNSNQINIDALDQYMNDYDFDDLFYNCNTNKIKGDIFEYIAKYYYLSKKIEVYLFNEIPINLQNQLKLGYIDKGIDLIYKFQNKWVGVQCKWRTKINECINKDLVSGFIEELKRTKLDYGYMFTNVNKITAYHLESNLKWITRLTLEKAINEEFINYIIDDESNIIITDAMEKPITQLRYYQQEAITKLFESHYPNKKCIMACGTGKSVIMVEYIKRKNSNRIAILLPSLQLISQFYKKLSVNIVDREILCICSQMDKTTLTCGEETNEIDAENTLNEFLALDETIYTTNPNIINNKLKLERLIVLCTYQSSKLLKYANFDLALFDEAHKTVNNHMFGYLLDNRNCVINERVYFTATPRYYKGKNENYVSMDNKIIYGNTCYEYSFKRAISEKQILDFQIVAYNVPENMEDIVTEKYIKNDNLNVHSEILISAIMLAQHIKNNKECTKILTYHNSVNNAIQFKKTLNYIFDKLGVIGNVYIMSGKTSMINRSKILIEFEKAKISIICSARVLNEGVDMPCINTVMFVDPRSSTIDVTQCIGRGMRQYEDQLYCNVIIPIHYNQINSKHNYSEIIRILTAMSEIDDKLIEYYVAKNINNKIVIKNMIVTDICNVDEVKYNLDNVMDNLKTEILDSHYLSFEYNKALLFKYCDENQCAPKKRTNYENQNIGKWLSHQKEKINGVDNELYKKLSINEHVKYNLDEYLTPDAKWNKSCKILFGYCNENKCVPIANTLYKNQNIGMWLSNQKKKINNENNELYKKLSVNGYIKNNLDEYLDPNIKWKEQCELLFKYCNENKCIPQHKIRYENQNIGMWLNTQKGKINNINDELYKKLSINKYIKNNLDNYLNNREHNRNKEKLEWERWCELLFKYCNENKCVPQYNTQYENQNIGPWLRTQKIKINDIENDLYKKLSINKFVRVNLDEYLNNKHLHDGKIILNWEDSCKLLFEYCNKNKCIPRRKTIYEKRDIGTWLKNQKIKMNSSEDELYKKLSINEYVKENLDIYLIKKN